MKIDKDAWLAIWSNIPALLWFALAIAALSIMKKQIRSIIDLIIWRLQAGSAIKIGSIEISAVHAAPGSELTPGDKQIGVRKDDGSRTKERSGTYQACRGVMLVHKLYKSNESGQLYDIMIYVIPHQSSSLATVKSVEYFFGHMWGDRIFPSIDRSRGFPVVTSAYGPFLCTAKLSFNDGHEEIIHRYIDFEMGAVAPCVKQEGNKAV